MRVAALFGKHERPKTCHYVLARGERLRLKRGYATHQNYYSVPGGVPVTRTSPEPETYARVVEVALKKGL